jgi:hypothetical protein
MEPIAIIAGLSLVTTIALTIVARGQTRGDKNNDMVAGLDKRVTSLEEHRQFLESLMSKIDSRFDKLEAKLEKR